MRPRDEGIGVHTTEPIIHHTGTAGSTPMAVRTVDIGEDHLAGIMAAVDSMGPPEVFHPGRHHLRRREPSTHG